MVEMRYQIEMKHMVYINRKFVRIMESEGEKNKKERKKEIESYHVDVYHLTIFIYNFKYLTSHK